MNVFLGRRADEDTGTGRHGDSGKDTMAPNGGNRRLHIAILQDLAGTSQTPLASRDSIQLEAPGDNPKARFIYPDPIPQGHALP